MLSEAILKAPDLPESRLISFTQLGILIIAVVGNAQTQLGLITFWQDIFKGIILILAVYFDQVREARALG